MSDIKIFGKGDDLALSQIKELEDSGIYSDSKIRIMPDFHAGAGCTIGTTIEIKDKITPNLVGVDEGCSILTIELKERDIDLTLLDNVVNEFIPSGFNIHKEKKSNFSFSNLIYRGHAKKSSNFDYDLLSLGTLGGGNHFIEVDRNNDGNLFLVIHSGSRNLGYRVAKHYQKIAITNLYNNEMGDAVKELIRLLKEKGQETNISKEIDELKSKMIPKVVDSLAYLTGDDFYDYLLDVNIVMKYASRNRETISKIIMSKLNIHKKTSFETVHNYVDIKTMILRKGATNAEKGKMLLIPINMRDGSIVALGKGNPDWNYSAPHGAGRLMSRSRAFKELDLDTFKKQMNGIKSSSITSSTLDESPDAYKSMEYILDSIKDTVDIVDIIKPIYNYKEH